MPTVSVLITTWNRAGLIGRAIAGVSGQTFDDWELIVADDGSTDNVEEVVADFQRNDKRIKYVRFPHVGRISVVANSGLRAATGEYVAILDDDDWWIDDRKLEKQVVFLNENRDFVACGGGFIVVDEHGNETTRVLKPEHDGQIRNVALYANPMANSTTMFRRSAAARVGFYDEGLRGFADWEFWLKLGLVGKLYNFPEYMAAYRMWHSGGSFVNQRVNADAAVCIVRQYKHKYPRRQLGALLANSYYVYTFAPRPVRNVLNSSLSTLKKKLFAK